MEPENQQQENIEAKIPEVSAPVKPKGESGVGALIGSIIVIILLIIGTIYLWNNKIINNSQTDNPGDIIQTEEPLSDSNEVTALEKDLDQTIIDLETEFTNLEINI